MTPHRHTTSIRHGLQETASLVRLSRRQRRALHRLEQELAADSVLRHQCESFPDEPPRSAPDATGTNPARDIVAPTMFAALMLTGTVLTVLGPALHATAVAMSGLALFLLAPVCVLVAAARAR